MNAGEVIGVALVEAGRHCSEIFEFVEEALDEVAEAIEVRAWIFVVSPPHERPYASASSDAAAAAETRIGCAKLKSPFGAQEQKQSYNDAKIII
jgi:hypothetical protein